MRRAGFPFLFGIYGTTATRETVKLLKDTGACGVLLLARNIETTEQTRALTEELVQRVGRPLIFSIDHEGGWVLRFREGVTPLPGPAALGRAKDESLAYAAGRQMALELLPLGIQLNLAPVLDVVAKGYNPGIGIRSFGADPALVGRLGAAMIRGLQDHGVAACAKHFPGKGAAKVDAHVELPTIALSRAEFERDHLRPFRDAVDAGVASVMTSHVRYPSIDKAIGTFSSKITGAILREKLGFDGVVIADDLCMGAVSGNMPIQQACVQAMAAGHDLLIVAHDKDVQGESAELMEQALAEGLLERAAFDASCERVEALLAPAAKKKAKASARQGAALAAEIAAKGLSLTRRGALKLPLAPANTPLLVVFPDFKQVEQRFTFEGGVAGPRARLEKRLKRWGAAKVALAPVETTDVSKLGPAVDAAERVLFFCYEARRFPGQKAALELLSRRAAKRTALVTIRGEWDAELAPKEMTVLDTAGYRESQLEAALDEVLA